MAEKVPCPRCGFANRANEMACIQCGTMFQTHRPSTVAPPPPLPSPWQTPSAPWHQPSSYPQSPPSNIPAYGLTPSVLPYGGFRNDGIWREGKKLICTKGAALPDFCVKCNAPATFRKNKKMVWYPKWIGALAFIPIVFLILFLIHQQKGEVEIGMCQSHRQNQVWLAVLGAVLICIGAGGFVFERLSDGGGNEVVFVVIGLVGLTMAALSQTTMSVWPDRMDETYVWLNGTSEAFRNRFPSA